MEPPKSITPAPVGRACTGCRAKKIRCAINSATGVCERCRRKGLECVMARSQPRAPSNRYELIKAKVQSRVSQLEDEIRRITSELANNKQQPYSALESERSNVSIATDSVPSQPRMLATNGTQANDNLYDVFDRGFVTVEQAEVLLQRFRHMARFFPYVMIPDSVGVSDMRRRHPAVLLAILVTSSSQNKPLQVKLEAEYRKTLSQRFLIEGESSLDMLQGLLVYLAWYHFHQKSVYRLTALAVSMVVELGINRRPKESEKEKMKVGFARPGVRDFSQNGPDFWNLEARRAFVGCYILCSRYALILRKLNYMPFESYIEECAHSIATESTVPTDTFIPYYVQIVHYSEDVNEVFGYSDCDYQQQMPDEQMQLCVKAFKTRLQDWRASIPPSVAADCPFLTPFWYKSEAYTYEISLYRNKNTPLTVFRTNILFDCLMAAKNFFDAILLTAVEEMQDWSTVEWSRLHYCIILVVRLTIDIECPSWDIAAVRETIKLESYLDIICQRVMRASEMLVGTNADNNAFTFLVVQWMAARNRYQAGLAKHGFQLPDAAMEQATSGHITDIPLQDLMRMDFGGLSGIDSGNFMASDGFWFTSDTGLWPQRF